MPLNTVDEQFISRSSRYRGAGERETRPKAVWAKRRQWSASRYAVHVAHVHQRGRFCTPVTQIPVKSVSLSLFTVHPAPCNYLSALATGFARELYIYMYETEVQFEIYIYREITEIVIHGTVCWFYKREERNEAKFRVVSFFLSFSFFLCLSLTSMSFLHAWREGSRARPTIMLIDVTGDTYLSFGTRARVPSIFLERI